MNPLKWIEKKAFLRDSETEYPSIKSTGTRFGCTVQVHKLRDNCKPVARLRVHQISDVNYFDLSADATRQLRDQLSEIIENEKGNTEPSIAH